MATGSQTLTTYYAKRIIGDGAATSASTALLQSGINDSMWIFGHNRGSYGIKYLKASSGTADKIEFYGGSAKASVQLDTGTISTSGNLVVSGTSKLTGHVGINADPEDSSGCNLYVNGTEKISTQLVVGSSSTTNTVIIKGTADDIPLLVRAIQGCAADGTRAETYTVTNTSLYLNYKGGPVFFGSTGTSLQTGDALNYVKIAYTTAASSTSSGALQVAGGAGIAEKLYVGDELHTGNAIILDNTSTSSSDAVKSSIQFNRGGAYNYITIPKTNNTYLAIASSVLTADTLMSIKYSSTANSNVFTVNANSTFNGTASITGNTSVGGNLTVTGTSKLTDSVGINTDPDSSYKLKINGVTYHGGVSYFSNGTNYYIGSTGNARMNKLDIYDAASGNTLTQYAVLQRLTLGTTSTIGSGRLILGNNIRSGTAENAQGILVLYGDGSGDDTGNKKFVTIKAEAVTSNIIMSATEDYFTMPKLVIENGLLRISNSGTTSADPAAVLSMSITDTTTNQNYTRSVIIGYQDHKASPAGFNLVITSGGNLFMGSGEGALNTYTNEFKENSNENTYLMSDGAVFIEAGANTRTERLGMEITSYHNVVPCLASTPTNNVGNLGTSTYKWANVYATALNGDSANVTNTVTVGNDSLTSETDVYVKSYSGEVALYSTGNNAGTGDRGLWFTAHGDGASATAVLADTNNNITFYAPTGGTGMAIRARGTYLPNIRFDTLASPSGADYTTTAQNTWGQLYCQVPAIKVSDSTYYSTRFFFREYSKTANTTTRRSYYEAYYLPAATDGLSQSKSYNILTDKDLSFSITGTAGGVAWANVSDKPSGTTISANTGKIYMLGYAAATKSAGLTYTLRTNENVYVSGTAGYLYAARVYNAVWNDYAETRKTEKVEPGRVVTENGKQMVQANKRLLPGCKVVSDTYGHCMGAEDDTPIAVSGRVLVYPYRAREEYQLGAAVCSAPDGTVDIMTRDEIMMYPERIIGTVSEIPDYDIWTCGSKTTPTEVQVNGRIWIYVK